MCWWRLTRDHCRTIPLSKHATPICNSQLSIKRYTRLETILLQKNNCMQPYFLHTEVSWPQSNRWSRPWLEMVLYPRHKMSPFPWFNMRYPLDQGEGWHLQVSVENHCWTSPLETLGELSSCTHARTHSHTRAQSVGSVCDPFSTKGCSRQHYVATVSTFHFNSSCKHNISAVFLKRALPKAQECGDFCYKETKKQIQK